MDDLNTLLRLLFVCREFAPSINVKERIKEWCKKNIPKLDRNDLLGISREKEIPPGFRLQAKRLAAKKRPEGSLGVVLGKMLNSRGFNPEDTDYLQTVTVREIKKWLRTGEDESLFKARSIINFLQTFEKSPSNPHPEIIGIRNNFILALKQLKVATNGLQARQLKHAISCIK